MSYRKSADGLIYTRLNTRCRSRAGIVGGSVRGLYERKDLTPDNIQRASTDMLPYRCNIMIAACLFFFWWECGRLRLAYWPWGVGWLVMCSASSQRSASSLLPRITRLLEYPALVNTTTLRSNSIYYYYH